MSFNKQPDEMPAAEVDYDPKNNPHKTHRGLKRVWLATGHSAVAAIDKLKSQNPRSIKFLCLLAAPAGIQTLHTAHPDVPIYTAAIDRELNDHGYILPGLGDAGDPIFGTK